METETFKIKTNNFEGPFGLLLTLIEKRKLHINDVSLSAVTEEYLGYLNKLGGFPPVEITNFVLVASTLLLIKSKSLLPNLDLTSEEKGDIKNLEERLRLYELFTKLGGNVKSNFGQRIIFAPLSRKNNLQAWGHTTLVFLPDNQITKESMMTLARNVLGEMPQKVFLPKVEVRKVVSLEEMIDKLKDRIENSLKINFKDFNGNGKKVTREEKVVVIIGFLAMLELVRQGIINAIQEIDSGDIFMEKQIL
ncbi:segregation/condensation protein A [Patescibacteria group bacterium]|nr:segregation/condensation protein A [Patescibacteria group bacterium]